MEQRFDRLAKPLAQGGSRRQALGWIGGILGGLVAFAGLGKATAGNNTSIDGLQRGGQR